MISVILQQRASSSVNPKSTLQRKNGIGLQTRDWTRFALHLVRNATCMPTRAKNNKHAITLPSRLFRDLQRVTPKHLDVTARVQRRVQQLGGGVLELVASREDCNRLLAGNPLPGGAKELRIRYLVTVRVPYGQ